MNVAFQWLFRLFPNRLEVIFEILFADKFLGVVLFFNRQALFNLDIRFYTRSLN